MLLGSKVVVLFPPTPKNRRLFLTWGAATRANQAKENMVVDCCLADYAEGVVKVEVGARLRSLVLGAPKHLMRFGLSFVRATNAGWRVCVRWAC